MHRWSTLFIPTLREAPTDAEVASHKLLLRAGYIRQLGAGLYSYLPLGQRSINKITAIVREEMDKIGQEFLLPALNPAEIWQESGRWTGMGQNMFRLKDRKGAELCLAMTHEEIMTSIARNELRSYKQLPQIWYQIQTKFRDEPRPKSGLLRVRQFLMKDAYSFDIDEAALDLSYNKHDAAYRTIFTRCGLDFVAVEADSGAMGGSQSQEFMVYTEAGEDLIASCQNCGYAANIEKATASLGPVVDLEPMGSGGPEERVTVGARTIAEVSELLGVRQDQTIKAVALLATYTFTNGIQEIPVLAFVRGDRELNETKLGTWIQKSFSGAELRMMIPEEIEGIWGVPHGFIGPYRLPRWRQIRPSIKQPQLYFDNYLEGRKNLVVGGNKLDVHVVNVTPGNDFQILQSQKVGGGLAITDEAELAKLDLLLVEDGDPCSVCGDPLRLGKAVEIGHIFKLGYKYSKSMGASVLDKDGKATTPIMGSYGIGLERILTAAIETSAANFTALTKDDPKATQQYALSPSIAPFEIIVTVTNIKEESLLTAGETIAAELSAAGIDTLLDDRDERAGVKFKDAELIGVPYRINIGKKLAEGQVELVDRLTGTTTDIAVNTITQHVQTLLSASKR
jgi:prolyl-tRNA synthetase